MSCAHHAHPPPQDPANEPGHFLSLSNGRCSGPLVFRERQQMQWAPFMFPACLASILGRSLPALLAVPNSFPEQSWDNLVFSNSRKHLWQIKRGERSKASRREAAKTTIPCPRIGLFPNSALALLRVLPQAHHRRKKRGSWAVRTDSCRS